MPVGSFRSNPRELNEAEQKIYARQYPEAGVPAGMGLGLAIPFLAGTFDLTGASLSVLATPGATVFGPILGGILGYYLGHRLQSRQLRSIDGPAVTES